MKRHKLVHEERKEKCSICGMMFHDKYDMLKHEQKHATSIVIFTPNETPCKICSMTFASIAEIKQHTKDHHPDSKMDRYSRAKMVFSCEKCEKL